MANLGKTYGNKTFDDLVLLQSRDYDEISKDAVQVVSAPMSLRQKYPGNKFLKTVNSTFKSAIWKLKYHKEGNSKYTQTRYISKGVYIELLKLSKRKKAEIQLEHILPR